MTLKVRWDAAVARGSVCTCAAAPGLWIAIFWILRRYSPAGIHVGMFWVYETVRRVSAWTILVLLKLDIGHSLLRGQVFPSGPMVVQDISKDSPAMG